jgi:outer membrane murein-binding lipoprotein Lpp
LPIFRFDKALGIARDIRARVEFKQIRSEIESKRRETAKAKNEIKRIRNELKSTRQETKQIREEQRSAKGEAERSEYRNRKKEYSRRSYSWRELRAAKEQPGWGHSSRPASAAGRGRNGRAARLRRYRGEEVRDDLPLPPPDPAPASRARRRQGIALLQPLIRPGHSVVPQLLPATEVERRTKLHHRGGYPGIPLLSSRPREDGAVHPPSPADSAATEPGR